MATVTKRAKVVVRYLDGSLLKGFTQNFDPERSNFDVHPMNGPEGQEPVRVAVRELKALFFVRDFAGDRAYDERKDFDVPFTGRRLSVRFVDGETLVGTTFAYDQTRAGFFLFPADPSSNNEKVYVNVAAVKEIARLVPGVRQPARAAR